VIRERWTEASGVRIHYLDNAPAVAEGLPVVFSPGIVDDADDYHEMLQFFAPRRAIVVDVRGRGRSESPTEGYSVDELAEDLCAAIDDASIDRFHLMTFSRGTPTALEVAFGKPDHVATISIGDYKVEEIQLPPAYIDSQWASTWRGRPMPDRVQRHVLEGVQRDSRARSLWDDVGRLGIPVMLAHGTERGSIVNEQILENYRKSIPGVEIVPIAGSGHDLFRPERLAYPRAVAAFLARHGDG